MNTMNYRQLKKENSMMHKSLARLSDYRMTDISNYIRELGIPSYHAEILKNRILKDMTSAEAEGQKIDTRIGTNYKKYVDDLRHSLPDATGNELKLDLLRVLGPMTLLLLALKAFYNAGTVAISGKSPVNTVFTIGDLSFIIMLLAISMVLLSFISQAPKRSFIKKKSYPKTKGEQASQETREKISDTKKLIYIGFTGIIVFLAAFSVWLLYKNTVLFSVPTIAVIAILVILSAVLYAVISSLSSRYESYDVTL